MSIFQDIKTLRWITLAVSFLFIPAFYLGLASLWSVGFAYLLCLFFRKRLIEINDSASVDDPIEASRIAKFAIMVLLIEYVAIAGAGIVLSNFLGYDFIFRRQAVGLDVPVYGYWGGLVFRGFEFEETFLAQQIMAIQVILSIQIFFGLIITTWGKFSKVTDYIVNVRFVYDPKKISHIGKFFIYRAYDGIVGPAFTILLLIFYLYLNSYLTGGNPDLADWKLVNLFFSICIFLWSSFSLFLFHTSLSAYFSGSGKIKKTLT